MLTPRRYSLLLCSTPGWVELLGAGGRAWIGGQEEGPDLSLGEVRGIGGGEGGMEEVGQRGPGLLLLPHHQKDVL